MDLLMFMEVWCWKEKFGLNNDTEVLPGERMACVSAWFT